MELNFYKEETEDKILYGINYLNYGKNIKWLSHNIKKGKIKDHGGYKYEESIIKNLTQLIECLNNVFKDDWLMRVTRYNNTFILTPIIYFKKIEIKNSKGLTHTIKDLFVAINIDKKLVIRYLHGKRYYQTLEENYNNYAHSHLPDNSWDSSFCLGDSEIKDLMQIIHGQDIFDINIYELFFHSLKTFVSWESLEGGPHRNIETVLNMKNNNNNFYIVPNSDLNYLDSIYIKLNLKDAKIKILNNKFIICEDDSLIEQIKNLLVENGLNRFIGFYDKNNKWNSIRHRIVNYSEYLKTDNNYYMLLNGKKFFHTVRRSQKEKEGININNLKVHKNATEYISKQTEAKLLSQYIRSCFIEKYYITQNA